MVELLLIYKWTIVAGILAASGLALQGCHVAARDRSMQTLCLGQGAMLGVLTGIGLQGYDHLVVSEWSFHVLPFVLSVVTTLSVGCVGLLLERRGLTPRNGYFIALFSLILSLNHLISAVMPGLEPHMAQIFFGDLAMLSSTDVWVTISFSCVHIVVQIIFQKGIANKSFTLAILGDTAAKLEARPWTFAADVIAFLYLCFAIQYLGFLFTISAMFIPTIAMNLSRVTGLLAHLRGAIFVGVIGTLSGFALSLWQSNLPTVPTITLCLALAGGIRGTPDWLRILANRRQRL